MVTTIKHTGVGLLSLAVMTLVIGVNTSLATSSESNAKGTIRYKESDWPTPPVDPEDPGTGVDTGEEIVKTEGPLRLDFVPRLTFGGQAISSQDQSYQANAQLFKGSQPARGNYIQVTDNRGTLEGWQLSVRQETQFKNDTAKNSELAGAILSFDKQWANSTMSQKIAPRIVKDTIKISEIGASYPLAIAEKGNGSGTWTIEFGSSGSVDGVENTLTPIINADGTPVLDATVGGKPMYKNSAITLFVPGKTAKDAVKYSTVLTWTIANL